MALTVEALSNCASYVSNTVTKSPFQNQNVNVSDMSAGQFIIFMIVFIALLYLIMWVGAFVFNTSVVKVIPGVKKVSVVDFLGLYIVIHLLFC
jgi:hypothetical protein